MFANPFWSVALLAGIFALYWFVIRPKAAFLEVGKDIESFWGRWFARFHRFRTYVVGAIGALFVAFPDILVSITPSDLSNLIGPDWAPKVGSAIAVYAVVNRAFSTKPIEKQ